MDIAIERPRKRQRLTRSRSDSPGEDLSYRRARNKLKLKSRFESIFDKYGRDFEGVGDEIDLTTGDIVVDNGHISNMRHERDAGGLREIHQDVSDELSEEVEETGEWTVDEHILNEQFLRQAREKTIALGGVGRMSPVEPSPEEGHYTDEADSLMGDPEPLPGWSASQENIWLSEAEQMSQGDADIEDDRSVLGGSAWQAQQENAAEAITMRISPGMEVAEHLGHRLHPVAPRTSSEGFCATDSEDEANGSPNGISVWATVGNVPFDKKPPIWTEKEESILKHLKATTSMPWKDMTPYLPGRGKNAIMLHWSDMMKREKANACAVVSEDSSVSAPAINPGNQEVVILDQARFQDQESDMDPISLHSLPITAKPPCREGTISKATYRNVTQPTKTRLNHDDNLRSTRPSLPLPQTRETKASSTPKMEIPNSTSSTQGTDVSLEPTIHESSSKPTSIESDECCQKSQYQERHELQEDALASQSALSTAVDGVATVSPLLRPVKIEEPYTAEILRALDPVSTVISITPSIANHGSLRMLPTVEGPDPPSSQYLSSSVGKRPKVRRKRQEKLSVSESQHGRPHSEVLGVGKTSKPRRPLGVKACGTSRKAFGGHIRAQPKSPCFKKSDAPRSNIDSDAAQTAFGSEDELSFPICTQRTPKSTRKQASNKPQSSHA